MTHGLCVSTYVYPPEKGLTMDSFSDSGWVRIDRDGRYVGVAAGRDVAEIVFREWAGPWATL